MATRKKQKTEAKIDMAATIRELANEKGFSEDSVKKTIENALLMAYKKTYGQNENAVVEFANDLSWVKIYSRREVVESEDDISDKSLEIALEEARKIKDDCVVGDTVDIEEDPKNFDRSAVTVGKQTAHGALSENYRDSLYNLYKDNVGEIIIGSGSMWIWAKTERLKALSLPSTKARANPTSQTTELRRWLLKSKRQIPVFSSS